jgi:hypothetical protein
MRTTSASTPPGTPSLSRHHKVIISGLPNEILSTAMMGAVLQQARLEDQVVRFSTTLGKTLGEVQLTLVSAEAVDLCVAHFHGCRWNSSGSTVAARIIPPSDVAIPSNIKRETLSAEAPVFVPAWFESTDQQSQEEEEDYPKGKQIRSISDVSTTFGESDTEDASVQVM